MIIYLLLGICLGIFLGILINKYIFSILDAKLKVYQYTQAEKVAKRYLNAQEMTMEFYRKYPEAKDDYQGETHAIGFQYTPLDDEEEYEEEHMIGF